MKFVFKSKNMLSSSPSIAQYKAPRKRKRKKRTFDVKACLFLIPVMLGTIVLLYSVRNTLHVSNRLFIKSFIFKIREQFSTQKSYYLYPSSVPHVSPLTHFSPFGHFSSVNYSL